MTTELKTYQTVKVEREGGITWVILNRPEKRNAMSPTMHHEMVDVLDQLADDDQTQVLVLTGAGESWCAGQDLKEFFRALDDKPAERRRAGWASQEWRWRRLWTFPKPTIAMVNGHCGVITPALEITSQRVQAVQELNIARGVQPEALPSSRSLTPASSRP